MRVNVYSQELTGDIDRVTKFGYDKAGRYVQFHAIRLYLHSAEELHHTPEDDDRSAVTIWLPRSLARRIDLAIALRAMAAWAEGSWPGGWAGWQDGPEELSVKIDRETTTRDLCPTCASADCPGIEGGVEACPSWREAEDRRARAEYLTTKPADPEELAKQTGS